MDNQMFFSRSDFLFWSVSGLRKSFKSARNNYETISELHNTLDEVKIIRNGILHCDSLPATFPSQYVWFGENKTASHFISTSGLSKFSGSRSPVQLKMRIRFTFLLHNRPNNTKTVLKGPCSRADWSSRIPIDSSRHMR